MTISRNFFELPGRTINFLAMAGLLGRTEFGGVLDTFLVLVSSNVVGAASAEGATMPKLEDQWLR
jgi:hypothetical protein